MKRLFYISVLASVLMFGLSSCEDHEDDVVVDNTLSIVSSNVIFDANGGDGTIVVSSNSSITATSASDWCTVSISGNTVNVKAAENYSASGRASRITIKSSTGESTYLAAQQRGIEFTFADATYLVEMAGGTVEISGKSTFPVEYECPDWITVTKTDDGYLLTIGNNTSGDARTGSFVVKTGDMSTTYTIKQKFDRNFSGTYDMTYYKSTSKTDANLNTCKAVITKAEDSETSYYLEIQDGVITGAKIPMTYDQTKELLYITNGTYIGTYSTYYLYFLVNYTNGTSNYYSVSTNANYNIYFSYKYVDGKYQIDLYNSGAWFSRTSQGMTLYAFKTDPSVALATANRVGSLAAYEYITMAQE